MSGLLRLTWRYLAFNKTKSFILFLCLAITIFLPLALHQLISYYEADLGQRARDTPLLVGAKGDRFDLVLGSLYFKGEAPEPITAAELDELRDYGRGEAIPLYLGFSAREKPIVGTTTDYFYFRGLTPATGSLPLQLGDAVIGSAAAAELGISADSALLSDDTSLINLAGSYPLKMHVVGTLKPTGTADDDAIFVDIKTAWIIAGIGHGHTEPVEPESTEPGSDEKDEAVTMTPATITYTEITPENIGSFHFHAERDELPMTSIIVVPNSDKDRTLLKGRYSAAENAQLLVPSEIVTELMGIVFKVKQFFDGSFLLVLISTLLFLTLVVLLSLRIRKRERLTMFHIGCDRLTVFWIQILELGILLLLASITAITAILLATPIVKNLIL